MSTHLMEASPARCHPLPRPQERPQLRQPCRCRHPWRSPQVWRCWPPGGGWSCRRLRWGRAGAGRLTDDG
jgi:hypothetical protein